MATIMQFQSCHAVNSGPRSPPCSPQQHGVRGPTSALAKRPALLSTLSGSAPLSRRLSCSTSLPEQAVKNDTRAHALHHHQQNAADEELHSSRQVALLAIVPVALMSFKWLVSTGAPALVVPAALLVVPIAGSGIRGLLAEGLSMAWRWTNWFASHQPIKQTDYPDTSHRVRSAPLRQRSPDRHMPPMPQQTSQAQMQQPVPTPLHVNAAQQQHNMHYGQDGSHVVNGHVAHASRHVSHAQQSLPLHSEFAGHQQAAYVAYTHVHSSWSRHPSYDSDDHIQQQQPTAARLQTFVEPQQAVHLPHSNSVSTLGGALQRQPSPVHIDVQSIPLPVHYGHTWLNELTSSIQTIKHSTETDLDLDWPVAEAPGNAMLRSNVCMSDSFPNHSLASVQRAGSLTAN